MKRKPRKLTIEIVRKEFEERGMTLLEVEYKTAKTKMRYICKCGNESEINYSNFQLGKNCKECGYLKIGDKKRKHTLESVREYFDSQGCQLLATEYTNINKKIPYICSCGFKTSITYGNFRNGQRCSKCRIRKISGHNSYLYKPELTDEDRLAGRNDYLIREWRTFIFKKDDFTCQKCGKKGRGDLNAHHIYNYKDYPRFRYTKQNGVTLCVKCHTQFHRTFGYGNNDLHQLFEFYEMSD